MTVPARNSPFILYFISKEPNSIPTTEVVGYGHPGKGKADRSFARYAGHSDERSHTAHDFSRGLEEWPDILPSKGLCNQVQIGGWKDQVTYSAGPNYDQTLSYIVHPSRSSRLPVNFTGKTGRTGRVTEKRNS